jgi:hypothetical protein
MISKPKSSKVQPKSNARHELKVTKTPAKSNGRHTPHTIPESRVKPAVKSHEPAHEKFHGVLQDFNFSPKGGIEGFLLRSNGQTVQINVTSDVGFAVVRGIGQTVEATVEPDHEIGKHGKGNHPVYTLVSLTGTEGKMLIHSGTGDAGMVTVQGTVKRINYARHGAANGVVLDSGDFIYLKPEGMKKVELKVGDHVSAEGTAAMMPLGQQVVEAKTVNGTSIAGKKPARGR